MWFLYKKLFVFCSRFLFFFIIFLVVFLVNFNLIYTAHYNCEQPNSFSKNCQQYYTQTYHFRIFKITLCYIKKSLFILKWYLSYIELNVINIYLNACVLFWIGSWFSHRSARKSTSNWSKSPWGIWQCRNSSYSTG